MLERRDGGGDGNIGSSSALGRAVLAFRFPLPLRVREREEVLDDAEMMDAREDAEERRGGGGRDSGRAGA